MNGGNGWAGPIRGRYVFAGDAEECGIQSESWW